MVACFRAVCWGDDHELGRQQTWREEKVNGLAKHAAIIHRARYNTQLRGEIHEEEKMDGDSDEEESFKKVLPFNNKKLRCTQRCDHIKHTPMDCASKYLAKRQTPGCYFFFEPS